MSTRAEKWGRRLSMACQATILLVLPYDYGGGWTILWRSALAALLFNISNELYERRKP